MAVSRLFPLALAFSVALIIAVSTVYTFINGYSEDFGLVFKFKRNQEPSVRQSTLDKGMPFPHTNIRLPKQVLPLSYRIYIHPNLTTFKFTGTVNILLRCFQPTKNLILHMRDLSVGEIQLTDSKQKRLTIVRRMQHKENQQYLIATNEELKEKERYSLNMEFSGVLSKNMEGFYRSSYKTKSGQVKYLATTQFEATNARSAFPCFDEPAFKAVFHITVAHDDNHKALSNMPLESSDRRHDGLVESRFSASVPMPTYLVAFIVCDFEYRESKTKSDRKIRVWSKPDALHSVDFALDVAKRTLEYYEDFFKVPYPLPKLDLIAIPDMGGAMENWGLVTFRESAVLFDPSTGSVADKKLVTMIVNHELAHQWFGNLVTMKWWNDLWLNEGFAVYMEYLATDNYNNHWKREDQFILDTSREALDVDSSMYTHPVSVKVHNPAEINEIVDKITYHKSSALIRMMQNFLGAETFRKGIQIYLKDHQFSNAKALDLWKAMSLATENHLDVATVMAPWVSQKGFPVISIISDNTQKKDGRLSYTASQKRFFRDFTSQHLKDGHTETPGWFIPLTYITRDSHDSINTVWMNKTSVTFQLSFSESGWFKANVGQTGFYRVNYDEENWKGLSQQLLHNHTVLSPSDRSGLIDDALSLARTGVLEYKIAFQIIEYINHELEYVPWAVTLRSMAYIGNMLSSRASYNLYQQFIVEKIKHLGMILGWKDTGELIDKSLRDLTLSTLCSHGNTECVNKSKKLFNDWSKVNGSKPIMSHLRKIIYYTAVKYGGQIEWEILWRKYKECKNAAEREKIISALGATRDKNVLKRLLKKVLMSSAEVRPQDFIQIIGTVASNPDGRWLAWKFFDKNFKKIVKRFGNESRTVAFLLEKTTENLNTRIDLRKVKDFFEEHQRMRLIKLSSKKILETIETNIYWMCTKIQKVERWLMDRQNKN
ncbi:unnamed protein product [Pocillopora meandrina]|uniref:Aminopeptidase n=1 Tax=Pocillopora meandrina TaxID=46732 RepID=A0AAU9WH66_9CNID|nr:unnamed protein product [Pocillopora meandrina]